MISLNITEKIVLLQTDRYRVVGLVLSGYGMDLSIEIAHKDALGDVSWHIIDTTRFNREGTTSGTDVTPDVLYAALDELMTVRARLLSAEQEIAEMKEQREDECLEAMEEYPE